MFMRSRMLLIRSCGCLLLATALAACAGNANTGGTDNRASSPSGETRDNSSATSQTASDDSSAPATQDSAGRNAEVCRKYDSCGCQKYDECMAALENDAYIDGPGVRECLLKSSCASLCANRADGCSGTNGAGNPSTAPRQTNCAAIPCGKNSDCPTECYGGCGDFRVCLSF
jgi:hypothetical protein